MTKIIIMTSAMMIMKNKNTTMMSWATLITFNINVHHPELVKTSFALVGDLLSFWVTNLSMWIMATVLMIKVNKAKTFNKIMSMMLNILILTFYLWNFFSFYIMFELSMVLILIIVMFWGYQPERIEATMFMIIMTILFALPFFVSLMNNFYKLSFWSNGQMMTIWDYASFMLIFMVKMPVFMIHMWLPKVHVESPVHGSMILAAIMLKLGCYGLIRMSKMSTAMTSKFKPSATAFCLTSALILSMVCAIQPDIKSLVAYSSVVHMTLTMVSILMQAKKSMFASVIIMVGHGMCSSAMFFMCNQMYKSSKSRSMLINKGILTMAPTVSTAWFIVCMSNAPMPPSINILGELLMFKALITWSAGTMVIAFFIMLFSSCYSIMVFCTPAHGTFSSNTSKPVKLTSKGLMVVNMHLIPAIFLITKASMMSI